MTKNLSYLIIPLVLVVLSGCKLPNESTVTNEQFPPTIKDASTSLSAINFGVLSIPANKNTVDTVITFYVSISDDNGLGDISSASYSILTPDGNLLTHGILADNGKAPDSVANDGKYTSSLSVNFPKDILGTYHVQFQITDNSGLTSIARSFPIRIYNSANTPPVIANLTAPDTVLVPSGSSVSYIRISISVSDQDGLNDIASVSLTSIRPNLTIVGTFLLYDDGGTIVRQTFPPFNLSSGDSIANDGRFTVTIPITSTNDKNTYRDFQFIARDQSNAFSNAITKRIYIQ